MTNETKCIYGRDHCHDDSKRILQCKYVPLCPLLRKQDGDGQLATGALIVKPSSRVDWKEEEGGEIHQPTRPGSP